jgi:hypothetical protein
MPKRITHGNQQRTNSEGTAGNRQSGRFADYRTGEGVYGDSEGDREQLQVDLGRCDYERD